MVPEGWRVATYGDAAEFNRETLSTRLERDTIIQYLDIGSVAAPGRIKAIQNFRFKDAPSRARRIIRPGDTIVSTVRPHLRAIVNFTSVPDNLIASTGFAVLSPVPEIDPQFLYQTTLREEFAAALVKRQTGSNYPAVRPADIAQLPLLLPPLSEQRKIAAILGSVDESIERTEAVILNLNAVKDAAMRKLLPSEGLSLFGTVKLGSVADTISGGTPDRADPGNFGGGILWVKSGEVVGRQIRVTDETLSLKGLNESAAKICPAGSVLVAMYGATAGKVGRLAVEAATNQAVLALIPRTDRLTGEFLYYRLVASATTLLGRTQGSGQPNLNAGLIRSLEVHLPTVEEQRVISDILSSFDDSIESEVAVLTALRHLKSALSNALLTGQLRVLRDEALP